MPMYPFPDKELMYPFRDRLVLKSRITISAGTPSSEGDVEPLPTGTFGFGEPAVPVTVEQLTVTVNPPPLVPPKKPSPELPLMGCQKRGVTPSNIPFVNKPQRCDQHVYTKGKCFVKIS